MHSAATARRRAEREQEFMAGHILRCGNLQPPSEQR
jgi:hypothetical protein